MNETLDDDAGQSRGDAPVVRRGELALRRDARGVLEAAQAEAARLLEAARADARRLLETARSEADQLRAEAEIDGAAAGKRAAARIAAEASSAARVELGRIPNQVAELVLACVRRVLGETPPADRIAAACRAAIADLAREHVRLLLVAPGRRTEVVAALAARGLDGAVQVAESDALLGDQALLETASGAIDLGLETQLAAIADGFAAVKATQK